MQVPTFVASYLQLGISHIVDLAKFDFILFILVLIALYRFSDWRKMFLLVIAYTMAHSLTLTLSSMGVVGAIDSGWVDFLVPLTVMVAAGANLFLSSEEEKPDAFGKKFWMNYSFASGFGLLHGFNFFHYFQGHATTTGSHVYNLLQLFSFNVGVELGQFLVACFALGLYYFALRYIRIGGLQWTYVVSCTVCMLSAAVAWLRFPL